jgi:hypothetical protein
MMKITDETREWVYSIAGGPVSDEEIIEFLQELKDYDRSVNCRNLTGLIPSQPLR